MNVMQETLERKRNTLAEYTKWLSTNEVCYLPSSVMTVLVRGERDLKDSIKNYEKLIDESAEKDQLPFSDEEYLVDDIGWEELERA